MASPRASSIWDTHTQAKPFFPRLISPNFAVLALACLWCLSARMWRVNLPPVREEHTELVFNTAHCVSILPQASTTAGRCAWHTDDCLCL